MILMEGNKRSNAKNAVLAAAAAVLIFVGGLMIGSNSRPAPENETAQAPRDARNDAPVGEAPAAAQAPKQDPTAACESSLRADAASRSADYGAGRVIVSFKQGVAFEGAKAFLDSHGLGIHNGSDIAGAFSEQRWLVASVPKGQEARWACVLRTYPEVRTTRLDETFKLAE